jgi:hypothetical protein
MPDAGAAGEVATGSIHKVQRGDGVNQSASINLDEHMQSTGRANLQDFQHE